MAKKKVVTKTSKTPKKTSITLVVDRSGSMMTVQSDAEGGINQFIDEQKKAPGDAVLTLVQFDTEYEAVCTVEPIEKVKKYELKPRGMTALLDAVGKAINETDEAIKKMPKKKRPDLIVVAIVTDGHENASKEFKKDQIKSLIEAREKDGWQFSFIGADADAFDEASSMGISGLRTAQYNPLKKAGAAYAVLSRSVTSVRSYGGQMVYTDEDRKDME